MDTVNYFKALADETRLRIMNLLYKKELNVNEIVSILGMGQSRISRHLKILTDTSLVSFRKDGLWVFYRALETGFSAELLRLLEPRFADENLFLVDSSHLEMYIKERGEKGKEYFNRVASEWKKIRREILGELDLNPEIARAAGKCSSASDLGCGDGELVEQLLLKSERVIGVDRSPAMLEEAAKHLSSRGCSGFDLRLGELAHLPVRDGESDCAVINMVLHYLDDPYAAIAESGRIVRSGGRLIIAELESHGNESLRSSYGHRWLGFSPDTVRGWAAAAGFTVKKTKSFTAANELNVILYISEKN